MASALTNGETNKVEECYEGNKMEAGSESASCCEQRIVNSAEPHVTFHDSGTYLPTSQKKTGQMYSVPVRSTAFSTPMPFNYASPASPKGSSVPQQGYPGTYTLVGGQNVSYFTTTPPTVSNQTTYSSMMPVSGTTAPFYPTAASTPYFPSSVAGQASDRAVVSQQYQAAYTTTTAKYPTTTPFVVDQQPQSYTLPEGYTLPQGYTLSQSAVAPQSGFTVPESNQVPSYQVPTTIEEGTYPFNYPAVADYPANLQAFNPNTAPFSQEELAAYFQNYLAKNQEPLAVDYAPSHKALSVKNDSAPPAKTNQFPHRKCAHGKPPVQRKRGKGCCGC